MELPVRSPVTGDGRKTSYKIETKNLAYKSSNFSGEWKWGCLQKHFKKSPKFILNDVSCEARPGDLTAVAGPSGAGKTTLLEILAGNITSGQVSGHVLINNHPINTKRFRRLAGYVTQDDALFPSLTVEETLMYSAFLRLRCGRKEAVDRVKILINELGLERVSSSRIGEGSNHGISGGERRRVSIGVELVHDPAVILIDEPTSGLDSGSAFGVVSLLKSMAANRGKTIMLTIHQPGFRILELFDRLVLLSNGFVLHNGSLKSLEHRLKVSGHCIPPRVNVLEFAIDVTTTLIIPTPKTAIEALENHEKPETQREFPYTNSHFEEVRILSKRFFKNIFRTKQLFLTRIIQAILSGLILGTIFVNMSTNKGKLALQARLGFFAFTLTFLLSSSTEGLPIFLQERRILMRETSRGAYRVSSYVISNTLIFLPFLLMIGILYTIPVYWLVGLRPEIERFFYFGLVVWMVILMSNSFTACFSALVPNFIMGTSVISGLMGCFFLFSGYFIAKDSIPKYWIFMHYMSLFKYPFECFMINEMYGDGFLEQQDIKETQKWSNLGVMLGFIIGYRLLCFFILWFRCHKTRN
ncbi:ABC transporter G family member 10 isoform X2 [Cynara cardunculus var. scolymus]|uniref:ABC transporter G family member 10 isoform X2 n=1 Tax=Cynara cardunculus var. scolymus TaxID=59895 RepID=UPI000D628F07|nr:ABC transporter G family member 10 isoform X2 [Cynara cardunculus var. scolymus]